MAASLVAEEPTATLARHVVTAADGSKFECRIPMPPASGSWLPGDSRASPKAQKGNEDEEDDDDEEEGEERGNEGVADGADDSSSTSSSSSSSSLSPFPALARRLEALSPTCLRKHGGYWTAELCHASRARQVHIEDAEVRASVRLGFLDASRDEIRSGLRLTSDAASDAASDSSSDGGRPAFVRHMRAGDGGREAEVWYMCDPPGMPGGSAAHLVAVQEPQPLHYRIVVGLRDAVLCRHLAPVSRFVRPMNETCIQRADGWWTVKVCLGQHVEQFHVEGSPPRVQASHSLGVYDWHAGEVLVHGASDTSSFAPQTRTSGTTGAPTTGTPTSGMPTSGTEEDHVDAAFLRSLQSFRADSAPAIEQWYRDGSPCDETGQQRRTRVRFECEEGEVLAFRSILEGPELCTYTITLTTESVCHHPVIQAYHEAMRPPPPTSIHCHPA